MRLPSVLTPHRVRVQDKTGDGAYGPVYAPERVLNRVRVEETRRMVRDSEGREVVSTATVWIRPEHAPVPAGSLVTLWPGTLRERTAEVLGVSHLDTPPAPEHDELHLT